MLPLRSMALPSTRKHLLQLKAAKFFRRGAGFFREQFDWFGKPSETVENVILCSGQGFQFVGMFLKLHRMNLMNESIANLMKVANHVVGKDIIHLGANGPQSELDRTINCQPIVTLASLIGAELMKKYKPWYLDTVCAIIIILLFYYGNRDVETL